MSQLGPSWIHTQRLICISSKSFCRRRFVGRKATSCTLSRRPHGKGRLAGSLMANGRWPMPGPTRALAGRNFSQFVVSLSCARLESPSRDPSMEPLEHIYLPLWLPYQARPAYLWRSLPCGPPQWPPPTRNIIYLLERSEQARKMDRRTTRWMDKTDAAHPNH